jgi:hypothetical protein
MCIIFIVAITILTIKSKIYDNYILNQVESGKKGVERKAGGIPALL